MDQLDIPALAERIREHRFTGYTDKMLADEIDRFRAGQGTGGLTGAVDALIAVGKALADTEKTLRTELGKLGVRWQSEAATRAGSVVAGQADFSNEAGERVNDSAERIFAQGEAFNRALHKLPDSEALRGLDPLSVVDSISSLLGFETDNTRRVQAARVARQQALDALNAYAEESGQNLMGMRALESPQAVTVSMEPQVPKSVDAGGGPRDVTTASGTTAVPANAPAQGTAPVAPHPAPAAGGNQYAPTPPLGMAAQQAPARRTGSAAPTPSVAPQTTAPSSTAPSSTAAPGGIAALPGSAGQRQTGTAAPTSPVTGTGTPAPGTGTPAAPGTSTGTPGGVAAVPGTPGQGGTERAPGGAAGSAKAPGGGVPGKTAGVSGVGTPGTTSVPGTGGTAGAPPAAGVVGGKPAVPGQGAQNEAQPLAKGKTFGAAPHPAPATGATSGAGFASAAAARAGASATDLGAGAAALGAGGVAGALSGEDERKGRGVGRSAPGAARSPHQLAIGDLPEEEARAQRNSDRLGGGTEQRRGGYLEKAAPQDEDDLGHVRRYGVDDNDLFTDQRMVSPDVIGDDDADGRR